MDMERFDLGRVITPSENVRGTVGVSPDRSRRNPLRQRPRQAKRSPSGEAGADKQPHKPLEVYDQKEHKRSVGSEEGQRLDIKA